MAAGFGSRMGQIGLNLNKSLISIKQKSAISRIIQNFPKNTNFVIATGYKNEQVKNFLKISHPKKNIKFVKIKNFSGPNSGPGLSLLKCKKYLQKPFFFVSCDTLFNKNVTKKNFNYNFLGVGKKKYGYKDYCNLEVKKNKITNIYDKIKPEKNFFNFTGLGYIKDYKKFWNLRYDKVIKKNFEISILLKPFIKNSDIRIVKMFWEDIGTEEKLSKIRKKYEKFDFSKPDEQIYIENDNVIKYHTKLEVQKKKYKRSLLNNDVFPKCSLSKNFLVYPFQHGENLYQSNSLKIFENYLKWLKNKLWIKKKVPTKQLFKVCENFYKKKTEERVKLFLKKNNRNDNFLKIHSKLYPDIFEIIKMIDFKNLCNSAIPTFIHGDLHFDNTIFNKKKKSFSLIDWRSDFSNKLSYGDQYYDLSKLYGGLQMNYSKIKENDFTFKTFNQNNTFSFRRAKNYKDYIKVYEKFLLKNNFSVKKIKIIVGLIYLNMSPLHQSPFDKLLFCLSKEYLYKALKND